MILFYKCLKIFKNKADEMLNYKRNTQNLDISKKMYIIATYIISLQKKIYFANKITFNN